ncbi:MAG: FtsK/SpoIIIE domain-containing protein [Clostridium sp.]|uniref:FtsK/SpoIIIE domain-containing protein n=1 Tax=Clostridium sp. TaxID=1506 RepID=UPI003EE4F408
MDLITCGLVAGSVAIVYETYTTHKNRSTKEYKLFEEIATDCKLEGCKLVRLEETKVGFDLIVKLKTGYKLEDIINKKEAISKAYECKCLVEDIKFSNKVKIHCMTAEKEIKAIPLQPIKCTPYQLVLGFNYLGEPITIDIKKTPHLGVCGASNSGKSKGVEAALKNINDKIDLYMLNCFADDFTSLKGERINEIDDITNFLKAVVESKEYHKQPQYILIDEYNVLSKVKGVDKAIQDVLAQARHYNVFLITLMQIGNKEDCKFKNLFNCRLAFRTIEASTLKAFLGVDTLQETDLQQQEFWLYHTELVKGKTYTIKC